MKFKKIILLSLIFISFLGIGSMLSNVQSREADQLLEAYGLSNNTRCIEIKNHQTISSFLRLLQKKYPQNKIQLHLINKKQPSQTLVWSNHDVVSLPTQAGRYFTADDFRGRVSFAVLSLNSQVETVKTQGNQYVVLGEKYYSVIGTLKHYHQMKQNGYYLTTGINQPSGQFKLANYVIVIDSSPKVIRRLAAKYHTAIKVPAFVKKHQIHQFSVLKEILAILALLVFAATCSLLLAVIDWDTVKQTHLTGRLLNNWLVNCGMRTILIQLLLAIGAYFFLRWRAFLSKPHHLLWLLLFSWLIVFISYNYKILLYFRKENAHD